MIDYLINLFYFLMILPLSKRWQLWMQSPGNMEGHGTLLDVLEHGDGLAVGHPLQNLAVDRENLVT